MINKAIVSIIIVFPLLSVYLRVADANASEIGRYQVMESDPLILIDTTSGRTWLLTLDARWQPINYTPLSKAQRESLSPGGADSAMERWQKEAEGRRLKLNKQKPAIGEDKKNQMKFEE